MIIGMILDNEFTGDLRVENEVISLVDAGFAVFVLALNHGSKPEKEDYHGCTIIRIPISVFKKKKMKGLTNTAFDLYTPYWSAKIMKFVKEFNIDILHVHDLYLLGGALKAKRELGTSIPVIADLHENYPEALKHYKFANTFPGNVLISIPKWEKTEVKWVQEANEVITVIEEGKKRYENLGITSEKICVVANYVNRTEYLSEDLNQKIQDKFKDHFTITYIGGFDIHRGLECIIRAIPLVIDKIKNLKFILVGDGINMQDLKELAKELNVEKHVSFEGWQPSTLGASYLISSDITLIPHLKTGHTDNTIPHKLFQYMLLERPVIATNCNPIERIINETKSGLIYKSNDEKDFAEKILSVYNQPETLKQMGLNGKNAVQNKYNWESTAETLVELYNKYSN